MAQTIIGIDLGAAAVKLVAIEVGFRVFRIADVFEEPVSPGDTPLAERQGEALERALGRAPAEATVYAALPGDMLAVRVLDLPFSDARKIEQVVGYELEGQMVHALQGVVFDHAVLRTPIAAAPGAAPGSPSGSTVLAVAARTQDVADALAQAGARGVEPRALFAAPVVYRALFAAGRAADEEPGCRLLLDVGHRRTNACFLWRGETIYARTITRGGMALTDAIAAAFRCSETEAEQAKREHGFVGSARRAAAGGPAAQRMDVALREALAPFLRELRQTLGSFRARDKTPIDRVLLAGGGAAQGGLVDYLADELELPVEPFVPEGLPAIDARFTLAAAIAQAGARGLKEIDLRRGPFQYRASFSVVRQKAAHLGVLAAALVVAASVDATMALARLTKQKEQLQAQLKSATQELFGEPRADARAVATLLKRGFREEMAPIPKATAFDLLGEISRKMPSAERIKLDITDLDIRPKKTVIAGTVSSAAAVDEIMGRLKEIDCFEEVAKAGPITEVSGGAKKFTLAIASKCP